MISLKSYATNKQKSYETESVIRHGVAQPGKYEVTLPTVQFFHRFSQIQIQCGILYFNWPWDFQRLPVCHSRRIFYRQYTVTSRERMQQQITT